MTNNEKKVQPKLYTYDYDGVKEWGFFELGKLKTLVHAQDDESLKVCDLYRLDVRLISNFQPAEIVGFKIEEIEVTKNKYGKYTNEIDKILEKITKFSLDDKTRLTAAEAAAAYADAADAAAYADAAYADAAEAAYADAAAYAAYAAAYATYAAAYAAAAYADAYYKDNWWKFRRVFWYAILAWLAKDKITPAQFDLLMTGWNAYVRGENA